MPSIDSDSVQNGQLWPLVSSGEPGGSLESILEGLLIRRGPGAPGLPARHGGGRCDSIVSSGPGSGSYRDSLPRPQLVIPRSSRSWPARKSNFFPGDPCRRSARFRSPENDRCREVSFAASPSAGERRGRRRPSDTDVATVPTGSPISCCDPGGFPLFPRPLPISA